MNWFLIVCTDTSQETLDFFAIISLLSNTVSVGTQVFIFYSGRHTWEVCGSEGLDTCWSSEHWRKTTWGHPT